MMERQLALEQHMLDYGMARLQRSCKLANEQGRGTETLYAKRLLKHHIEPLTSAVATYINGLARVGRGAKYAVLFRLLPADVQAVIAMKTAVSFAVLPHDQATVTAVATSIGRRIEDEVRFRQFQKQYPGYVNTLLKDFKKRGTTNYRYMHRVMTFQANRVNDGWAAWGRNDVVHIGSVLLNLVAETTGLVTPRFVQHAGRGKSKWVVTMTEEARLWVQGYIEHVGSFLPVRMPCLIQPDDWVDQHNGGYYLPELRSTTPFCKPKYPYMQRKYTKALQGEPLTLPRAAANAMQGTAWAINTEVLAVMKEVWQRGLGCGIPSGAPLQVPDAPVRRDEDVSKLPPEQRLLFEEWKAVAKEVHKAERIRAAHAAQFISTLRRAVDFSTEDALHFVYTADFRGRLYATTTDLSPQGASFSKGLLKFKQGMPLGNGEHWWWIHGANTFGKDKLSYTERVEYAKSNVDDWCRVANDPLGNRDVWGNADKPWQFLAWCFEVRDFCNGTLHSHLPVALDGSCNGLQHFSAMLRDQVGGSATNLIDADRPSDIYQTVADVVLRKLLLSDHALAKLWVQVGVNRKLVKKPVMTLPYGSTPHACIRSLLAYTDEHAVGVFEKPFAAAAWLTPIVWESIGEVVVAARAAMDWLREAGDIMAGEESPMMWHNAAGFPVWQWYNKHTVSRIKTMLMGQQVQLNIAKATDYADSNRMKSGTSPNFVHSCDAAHLVKTVCAASARGIANFAVIHDDYGTHACNTEEFSRIIREQFYDMYNEHDVLNDFKSNIERTGVKLPELPSVGTLDIKEVLKSRYFFG